MGGIEIGLEPLRKPRKISVRIISVSTEIRIGHLPTISEPTYILLYELYCPCLESNSDLSVVRPPELSWQLQFVTKLDARVTTGRSPLVCLLCHSLKWDCCKKSETCLLVTTGALEKQSQILKKTKTVTYIKRKVIMNTKQQVITGLQPLSPAMCRL